MKKHALHFFYRFNKGQRKGIVALFLLILIFQAAYFVFTTIDFQSKEQKSAEEKEWLSLQSEIDRLKSRGDEKEEKIYPFNPNYISDYKGYVLGMTAEQIDRLHAYRDSGKFINTPEEFRFVTKVPDSIFNRISPYFKFPEFKQHNAVAEVAIVDIVNKPADKSLAIMNINAAQEEDLIKVNGIGPQYAKMILRRRAQLGGFVSLEQMDDFSDLSTEVIGRLKKQFIVNDNPQITKININTASLSQLAYFPYFNRQLAKAILTQRSMKGKFSKIEELLEINGFPIEKKKIIALYLDF